MEKIKTKADLIRMIEALPDTWVPTTVISWRQPETVSVGQGFEEREFFNYLEIRIDGPTDRMVISTGVLS